MQILMFVLEDDSPDADLSDDIDAWVAEADKKGSRVVGGPLVPIEEAVTIRVRDGQIHSGDGTVGGAGSDLLGFDLLECASLDVAVELAALHPMARRGRVELRALLS